MKGIVLRSSFCHFDELIAIILGIRALTEADIVGDYWGKR
jgi:hypothetical protein